MRITCVGLVGTGGGCPMTDEALAPKMTKIVVSGSREWDNDTWKMVCADIHEFVEKLPSDTTILHGWAPGVDSMVHMWAEKRSDLNLDPRRPNYDKYHWKEAPLRRNDEMLEENPEYLAAFWNGKKGGTKYTISKAKQMGIPVKLFTYGYKLYRGI